MNFDKKQAPQTAVLRRLRSLFVRNFELNGRSPCRHRLSVLFPTEQQTFCNPELWEQDRSALSFPYTDF